MASSSYSVVRHCHFFCWCLILWQWTGAKGRVSHEPSHSMENYARGPRTEKHSRYLRWGTVGGQDVTEVSVVTELSEVFRQLIPDNETESLAHDSSEQNSVVFVADGSGYVPISQLRARPGLDDLDYHHVETWDRDYRRQRSNTTRVQHIEAECQDDYMKIRIGFNGSFGGLLYSSGYAYDPDCVYINGTGRDYYEFYIQLNRCGTLGRNTHHEDSRKAPTKNFMWNTVTVQYNALIEEEWDEHFKVTCEYGYDFWKTVTFPFIDVEVATGNPVVFTLSPPECYMEIRHGYGTSGTRVSGPVRVGDPLTLIIYMRSKYDGFDIVVNDCYAHNGATKKIQLIDQYGCPVDDKLISRFRGSWSETGVFETQVFAYMKTFRFTGSPALYIECDVRMCHGRCPSQPCHWRNAKTITKRSIASTTLAPSPPQALSENVSLFQSLRVLQDGETSDADSSPSNRLSKLGLRPRLRISLRGITWRDVWQCATCISATPGSNNCPVPDLNSVCLKTSAFSALLGLGCVLLCLLSFGVVSLCCRLRRLKIAVLEKDVISSTESPSLFDHMGFMTHKGRIN